jgi:uncharacterized integral membrane protein (TIGR00697 family)
MLQLSENAFRKLILALAVYLTALFSANTLGLKVMPFLFGAHLSVAVFSFPIVFIMTDVVGEIYGKRIARLFVLAGFISTTLFIVYSLISIWLPWSSDGLWAKEGYNQIFGLTARMAVASVVAFGVGEYQDVFAFFFFKNKLGSKHFWLRSLLSNIWSQFLDTVLFMTVAFAGVYSWPVFFSIVITWWIYKVIMGALFTPLSYIGLRLLKDDNKAA